MITTIIIILTILITLVYIIACMLGTMVFYLRVPILILLIACIPVVIIKIYYQIKKYGAKKVFRVFSKTSIENEQQNLVEHILRIWKSIHYIHKTKENLLLFISKSGIYIIKVIDYYGNIIGGEKDDILTLKNESTSIIDNFFKRLNEVEVELKVYLPNIPIQKIIVSKETCTIGIPYSDEYLIIGIHSFYCRTKILEKNVLLSEEKVKEIDLIIQNYLGENL